MTTLTIELPESLLAALRRTPQEMSAEIRLAAAIDWYRRGLVSQGRAAEIAGLGRADFIHELAARQTEAVQVNLDNLDKELELV
jgi:predicted HTH domain antitoxin